MQRFRKCCTHIRSISLKMFLCCGVNREDIIRRDNDIEMLTQQLRSQAPPADAAYYANNGGMLRGLCLRCARNEAILPAPTDTQSSLAAAQMRRYTFHTHK